MISFGFSFKKKHNNNGIKRLFSFKTQLVSGVYCEDCRIVVYLPVCLEGNEKKTIEEISIVIGHECMHHVLTEFESKQQEKMIGAMGLK